MSVRQTERVAAVPRRLRRLAARDGVGRGETGRVRRKALARRLEGEGAETIREHAESTMSPEERRRLEQLRALGYAN